MLSEDEGRVVAARRAELRGAVAELSSRGLVEAAKWCAEQLVGLPLEEEYPTSSVGAGKRASSTGRQETDREGDICLLAKTFFDCKEYKRAAAHLSGATSKRAAFLRGYATYLAGAKGREEELVERAGPLGKADAVNEELEGLEAELSRLHAARGLDGFGLYLFGLVLIDLEREAEALAVLSASVAAFPCNWSAWQALASLCRNRGGAAGVQLPNHWATEFFLAGLCLELQQDEDGLARLQELYTQFPNSTHVVMQSAVAHYNLRNFDDAQALFVDLQSHDEFRIDGMDIFSNILYVKECFAELSSLAHHTSKTEKYRPETCCIIGNYYSLKGQHEKAVMYFRRALKLNRNYLSAWTLMGHEFVEMKNPAAAIDAYRRAVDINPRDYRAWYGLGQAYELIMMPYYALYYFRRATQLRPHDARMWCAMGQCYENEQLGMEDAAIQCYKRAVSNDDREGIALHKLAKLHERQNKPDGAAYYYALNLERIDADQATGSDALAALAFLAQYYRDKGQLQLAEQFCNRLLDYGGPQRDRAAALLREVHSLQQHARQRGEVGVDLAARASPALSDLDLSPS